jgi:cytidine deaminase
MDANELLEKARASAVASYSPYSGFPVGAAVLARDGRVFTAANVENVSYGLSLCAERAALGRAVAEGVRPGDVAAVAATAAPCGGCRQWLAEFGVDQVVFPWKGELTVRTLDELLPDAFRLSG